MTTRMVEVAAVLLILLLAHICVVSAQPISSPTPIGRTQIEGANLTYTAELIAGWNGYIKVRWIPKNPHDYRIFLLIPPEGIKVNNSLTPIVFTHEYTFFSGGHVINDPVFTWKFTAPLVASYQEYTFRLVVISSNYTLHHSLSRTNQSGLVTVVNQARIVFGQAYLHEYAIKVKVYNPAGIKKQADQKVADLQDQLNRVRSFYANKVAQLSQKISSLESQLSKANGLIREYRKNLTIANLTIANLTRLYKYHYTLSKAGLSIGLVVLFLIFMWLIPYIQYTIKMREYDDSFAK